MDFSGRFWINKDGKSLLGDGKIALLRHIESSGSILKAAKAMQMSYKAAWDDVQSMNSANGEPLVMNGSGKRSGSTLSPKAYELLNYFEAIHGYFDSFMRELSNTHSFEAKIIGVWQDSHVLDASGLRLYSAITQREKVFNIGDAVSGMIITTRLMPMLPIASDLVLVANKIPCEVQAVADNLIEFDTAIGRLALAGRFMGLEAGMKLMLLCSANDVLIY